MDDIEWKRLARKRERLRKHGTLSPFCVACGEHHWAVRYELHHFALRKFDARVIRLCQTCHDKASDMQKDYPPISPDTDPRLAKIIAIVRGRIIMSQLMIQTDNEIHDWLTSTPPLPPVISEGQSRA